MDPECWSRLPLDSVVFYQIQSHKFVKNTDPVSSEISDLCEISDLLIFVSHFAS